MRIPLDGTVRALLVVRVRVFDRAGEWSVVLRAAVDTGASGMMIPVEAARLLGYPLESTPREPVVTGQGVLNAPKVVLGRVEIEGASATDVDATCHDLPEESLVDALVGLSFLTRFDVSFDFDSWEMELTPRG